jgi:hypothetical protein
MPHMGSKSVTINPIMLNLIMIGNRRDFGV